ncbi:MAG: type VI secretion system-associated FHA domain protein TagH [Acidobacteria bacterium]|nr:type VI secretion system-associated FHA domain protein TagH [Acidobacteriota bacterium]
MNLTLEVISPGGNPGNPTRKVFGEEGGTIGRATNNAWVLMRGEVSGKHAVISCRAGVFYIQDTSRNGICLNSLSNKLVPQRPYPLKSGDRLFIEPFEIAVTVGDAAGQGAWPASADPFALDDPFAPAPLSPGFAGAPLQGAGVPLPLDEGEVDPLKFFQPSTPPRVEPRPAPAPQRGPADALLDAQFPLPVPIAPSAPPAQPAEPNNIPAGYDPLADDAFMAAPVHPEPVIAPPAPRPAAPPPVPPAKPPAAQPIAAPRPSPSKGRSIPARKTGVFSMPPEVAAHQAQQAPAASEAPAPPRAPQPARPAEPPAASPAPRVPASAPSAEAFAQLLEGAGLSGAPITPELTRNFGRILRIVVSGLMDVLQARQGIKEEFRMRQTMFRPADNNPLKFSVNVDDALHNLLVKKNPAYLGAVDAFADAFDDLRDHQLAMLAGMRLAFEHLMAAFDPERLQQEFDAAAAKGAFPLMPAKLRYWDLFIEKRREMLRDPEAAFAELFGSEFARAYEEQFRLLKAQRKATTAQADPHSPGSGE